jgi:Family of unknown function (DUF6261)
MISVSKMSPEKKITASLTTIENTKTNIQNDQLLDSLIEDIQNKIPALQCALPSKNEKEFTAKLENLDAKRGDIYRCIYNVVRGFSYFHPDKDVEFQINSIFNRLAENGLAFLQDSIYEETTNIAEKLDFLKNPEYNTIFEQLNLKPVITTLEETNSQFLEMYQTRLEKKQNRPMPRREAAIPLDKAIRTLATYIDSKYGQETINKCFAPFIQMK